MTMRADCIAMTPHAPRLMVALTGVMLGIMTFVLGCPGCDGERDTREAAPGRGDGAHGTRAQSDRGQGSELEDCLRSSDRLRIFSAACYLHDWCGGPDVTLHPTTMDGLDKWRALADVHLRWLESLPPERRRKVLVGFLHPEVLDQDRPSLQVFLRSANRDHMLAAMSYLAHRWDGPSAFPHLEDRPGVSLFSACRSLAKTHLEWLEQQDAERRKEIIDGFPQFLMFRSPHFFY